VSRKNEDLIVLVLDRSGSMSTGYEQHLKGVNEFIDGQRKVPKPGRLTLVQFDDDYQIDYEEAPISDVRVLTKETYVPRGMTALLDAIGKTINSIGRELSSRMERDRPDNVIVVIQTDGQENASREYVKEKVADMIRTQREKYGWQFIFLGAGIDAIGTAASLNIPASHSIGYNKRSGVGTMSTYGAATRMVGASRMGAKVQGFTDQDREDANKEDSK